MLLHRGLFRFWRLGLAVQPRRAWLYRVVVGLWKPE